MPAYRGKIGVEMITRFQFGCLRCRKIVTVSLTTDAKDKLYQCKCKNSFLKVSTLAGYLYILSNPSMPGLLKIGLTTRTVDERVAELNSASGVPTAFAIEAVYESLNPKIDEAAIHESLKAKRVPGREFFRIGLGAALNAANLITKSLPVQLGDSVGKEFNSQNHDVSPNPAFSTGASWRCGTCAHEFSSDSGWCPICGGNSFRLNWGKE